MDQKEQVLIQEILDRKSGLLTIHLTRVSPSPEARRRKENTLTLQWHQCFNIHTEEKSAGRQLSQIPIRYGGTLWTFHKLHLLLLFQLVKGLKDEQEVGESAALLAPYRDWPCTPFNAEWYMFICYGEKKRMWIMITLQMGLQPFTHGWCIRGVYLQDHQSGADIHQVKQKMWASCHTPMKPNIHYLTDNLDLD